MFISVLLQVFRQFSKSEFIKSYRLFGLNFTFSEPQRNEEITSETSGLITNFEETLLGRSMPDPIRNLLRSRRFYRLILEMCCSIN